MWWYYNISSCIAIYLYHIILCMCKFTQDVVYTHINTNVYLFGNGDPHIQTLVKMWCMYMSQSEYCDTNPIYRFVIKRFWCKLECTQKVWWSIGEKLNGENLSGVLFGDELFS